MRRTDAQIFSEIPNELKTLEVDVEKKIFKVNGVPFGKKCTGFRISCKAGDGFSIRMDIDTTVELASYDACGNKKAGYSYEKQEVTSGEL